MSEKINQVEPEITSEDIEEVSSSHIQITKNNSIINKTPRK